MNNIETTREPTLRFGGQIGNYVIKRDHIIGHNIIQDEELKQIQNEIHDLCDMGSEYFTHQLLNKDNDHFLDKLDINLNKFVEDRDYYFFIFDHQRDTYDMIVKWYENNINNYWIQLNRWRFGRSKTEDHLFIDVINETIDRLGYDWDTDEEPVEEMVLNLSKQFREDCVFNYNVGEGVRQIEGRLKKRGKKWNGSMLDDDTMIRGEEGNEWID